MPNQWESVTRSDGATIYVRHDGMVAVTDYEVLYGARRHVLTIDRRLPRDELLAVAGELLPNMPTVLSTADIFGGNGDHALIIETTDPVLSRLSWDRLQYLGGDEV